MGVKLGVLQKEKGIDCGCLTESFENNAWTLQELKEEEKTSY